MVKIGEEISEQLDLVPMQVRVVIVKSIALGQIRSPIAGADNYFDRGGTCHSGTLEFIAVTAIWPAFRLGCN